VAFSTVSVDYIPAGADPNGDWDGPEAALFHDTVAEDIRVAVTGRLNAGWSLVGSRRSNFTIFLIFEKKHD
jgi:hypothetical protein